MKFSLVSNGTDCVKVALQGSIQASNVARAEPDQLADLIGDGWSARRVLIDFHGVSMAGSAAIGWLLAMNRKFKESGGRMVLHSMRPDVAQSFRLLHVDSILKICPEEQAALAALKEPHG